MSDNTKEILIFGGLGELIGIRIMLAVIQALAAPGTSGAAAITSGLAALGHLVGCGMIAGLIIFAVASVVFAAFFCWICRRFKRTYWPFIQKMYQFLNSSTQVAARIA